MTSARRQWKQLTVMAVIAIVAGSAGAFAMYMHEYTESASFCGRCHTMRPELEAYKRGPHRDVKCAECHMAPGLSAFIKSKINGTRQLFEVITNTAPRPIRAEPDRLPPPEVTCLRCHEHLDERPDVVLIRSRFGEDEKSTEQRVGLAVRLNSTGPAGGGRIHGHIDLKIEFVSADHGERIDWFRVERPDGSTAEYVSADAVKISSLVGPEIEALKREHEVRTFTCTDCHNRAGHELIPPDVAIDNALAQGKLDRTLPYIKREALRILAEDYPSRDLAFAAIATLPDFYAQDYPEVFAAKRSSIDRAVLTLRKIYEESASPEMKASYKVYPTSLGHQTASGCFRCHDGAHLRIEQGAVTRAPLAWECSTCHTFPVWGSDVVSIAVNQPPQYHTQPVWLFQHKDVAKVSAPVPVPCSNCHTPSFCVNCHATGVRHDQMLFSHAALARERGTQTCAFCHQRVYCSRCHDAQLLDRSWTFPTPHPR